MKYPLFLEVVESWKIDYSIFCFDASSIDSYRNMKKMFDSIRSFNGESERITIPRESIIIALKMELIPDQDDLHTLMARSTLEEAIQWVNENKLIFFEVSISQNIGVSQLFQYLTKQRRQINPTTYKQHASAKAI